MAPALPSSTPPSSSAATQAAGGRPPAVAPPRRAVLLAIIPAITALGASGSVVTPAARAAAPPAQPAAPAADNFEPMALLEGKDYGKPRTTLSDFVKTKTGLQYKDLVDGKGEVAGPGDAVTVDWDGYTIGYYGRPFEARNKARGGAFVGADKDFLRFSLGDGSVVAGFEEAITGMRPGGVRRVIVPVELGYPGGDFKNIGPKPTTFSGKRALSFVLKNQGMIDKTLMFDIELLKLNRVGRAGV